MQNQYALFAGQFDLAAGGWDDFVALGTLDECKAHLSAWNADIARSPDWAHIVDLSAQKIVLWLGGYGTSAYAWRDSDPERP